MLLQALVIAALLYQGTAETASSGRKDYIAFFNYDWWIILGQTGNSDTLNGLTIHINDVETSNDGPRDMMSWEFKGNRNSYIRVENPADGPLTFSNSFTIGTYIYQDYTRNGPIVEWAGRQQDNFGTHFWIWESLLFINMGTTWGNPRAQNWHATVPPGGWHFIAVSYNHMTGNLTMWLDSVDNVYEHHVGTRTPSCVGDVFIGNRPKQRTFNPLKAKLAGLTILNGPVNRMQIKEFKCNIVAFVANESPPVSYEDWIPHTDDLFMDCFFEPDELPPDIQGLPEALPKTYNCSNQSPHEYFGTSWWNILGQDENNPNLNGLQMNIAGVSTTFDGPNGIPAWNFLGSPNSYIKIPNAPGGPLDMQDSFTIGTFFYQSEIRNGAIFEWRGSPRRKFATHFWMWNHKLFVNLVGTVTSLSYPSSVPLNSWHFIGISFNRDTGNVFIWLDDARNIQRSYVGYGSRRGRPRAYAFGDVYIGNRGSQHNFVPFKGKLAGLTVLDGAIGTSDIEAFKCKILTNVALGLPRPNATEDAVPKILGNSWWMVLGQNTRSKTRNGVELQVNGVSRSSGPLGLTSWDFAGTTSSYIKINNPQHGALNFNASFTIGTFMYQDSTKNGPIVEWRGKRHNWGTHFWIWQNVLFLNLAPRFGGRSEHFYDSVGPKEWRFVGVTFDHGTGNLIMWVDGDNQQQNIGRRSPDCRGNVYIGNRPSARWFNPFKGRLAGLTLLKGSIDASQIKQFKCLIVAVALKGSYPENWDPTSEDSFERCNLQPDPTPEPPKPANPRNYSCSSPTSGNYFGFNWWNLLGQSQVHRNLRGVSLQVFGVDITRDGPNGIAAWNFKGSSRSYIRILNPSGGQLNLDSFTIGTFIYQRQIHNGAIVEWRGTGGDFGTHFWIWGQVPFVNLIYGYVHFNEAVPVNGWHFIGMSYNMRTSKLLMWIDDPNTTNVRRIYSRTSACRGDVYIGNRGSNHNFSPFKGKLAGLTIISGAITENQIEDFKCMTLATARDVTASA